MLSAEVSLDVDIDADDVMQAHRERMEQAGQLGFAVSQEEVPFDEGTLKASGFGPEWRQDTLIIGYQYGERHRADTGSPNRHASPD